MPSKNKTRTIWLVIRALLGDWRALPKLAKENIGLVILVASGIILIVIFIFMFLAAIATKIACGNIGVRAYSWLTSLFGDNPDFCSYL